MKTLGSRVAFWRAQKRLNQEQLARKAGVSQTTISNIESGRNKETKHLARIAKALGITMDALLYGDNFEPGPETQGMVPVISWVAAGHWTGVDSMDRDVVEWLPCPKRRCERLFALRVKGDSMSPKFLDGDVVFVDMEAPQDEGRVVIAVTAGMEEATMKQLVRYDGRFYLKPLNPDWPGPKFIEIDDEVHIVGVAVGRWTDC